MSQQKALAVLVAAALSLGTAAAGADTVYNFDSVVNQGTPTTLQGATFSSPSDATTAGGAFTFEANPGLYSTIGASTVLSSNGYSATLDISFAQAQTGVSFQFAGGDGFGASGSDLLTVTATTTANTQVTWTVNPTVSYIYPEGLFSVAGAQAFTSLAITESDAAGEDSLTIANMTSTPVPLPPSLLLLASGLVGLCWTMRRRLLPAFG
jgi:hypothetical protein